MNLTTRVTALESAVADLASGQQQIIALLTASAPAKAQPKAAAPKARKAQPKAAAPVKVRFLCKATRSDFVAAAPVFQGASTKVIAAMCIEDPRLIPAGFAIGPRYTEMFSA